MIYEESSVVHNLTIIPVLHIKIGFAKLQTIILIDKFWLLNFDILFNFFKNFFNTFIGTLLVRRLMQP